MFYYAINVACFIKLKLSIQELANFIPKISEKEENFQV